jgi:hypothetical protein
MLIDNDYLYVHASREHYEPIERFEINGSPYMAAIQRLLPPDWQLLRGSIWMNALPKDVPVPGQGWKIHVSATPANATPILATVARILIPARVPFKFVASTEMLLMQNGKRWSRGGAGKFITVYPRDQEQCGELLEKLYTALIGYRGPYILSDRRYKDSGVVFYRYGGMLNYHRLDITGRRVPVISAGDGNWVDDERSAYFRLPPTMTDPFATEPEPLQQDSTGGAPTLKNGRYTIEQAIVFSNSGGVYIGRDNTNGQQVLIKEARPLTNVSIRGIDAVWLLKKEQRLLELVEDLKIGPKPIDFFQEWEHFYLVEEYLDGLIMRVYMARHSLALRIRPDAEAAREFYARYTRTMARIADIVAMLHERHICFTDLSHYNVMIVGDGDDADIRLIDFEGAYEEGVDMPPALYTPGFAPQEVIEEGIAQMDDDLYAMGSLMLAGLIPINAIMSLDLDAPMRIIDTFRRDFKTPDPLVDTIRGLFARKRADRPRATEVARVLRAEYDYAPPEIGTYEADNTDLDALLREVVKYIMASADPTREDRLFPADPIIFETNPMSIAHGAAGVAHALRRITGTVPDEVRDWMLRRELSQEAYPPGLYSGLAGVAWVLLEMGEAERARKTLELARTHPLVRRESDVFYGAAGWGMTELRFHLHDGASSYLAHAEEAARHLLETREENEAGWFWRSQKAVSCTFAHGASGIATFFVYLYQATGKEEYLDAARRALDFVASKTIPIPDDGVSWRAREEEPTYTPYWRWGSAGIGQAYLRYLTVVPDGPYWELFDKLVVDCDRKYSIFPGRFFGLSGIGDFCLDWAELGPNREHALVAAKKALSGTLMYPVNRPNGIAFPGDTLSRVSCDYGTGGAGIAIFLHRVLHGGATDFMLDDLLPARAAAPELPLVVNA